MIEHLSPAGSPAAASLLGAPAVERYRLVLGRPESERRRAGDRLAPHTPAGEEVTALDGERVLVVRREATSSGVDPLTGLLDRRGFVAAVDEALAGTEGAVAVVVCDLDRLSLVNDSIGQGRGDEVLVILARRIVGAIGPDDRVARLGGDEFAVLLGSVPDPSAALAVAERVRKALGTTVSIGGHQVVVAGSVGMAIGDRRTAAGESLLHDASAAVLHAKQVGRGRVELFDESLRAAMIERMTVEAELLVAIGRGELRVHYQPEVSFRSGRVIGVEALVRWQHPTRGLLGAPAFVPVAEERGLIDELGAAVLRTACADTERWLRRHGERAPRLTRVNLSTRQLLDPDIVERVAGVLEETGCPPERLCLEVTESLLIRDPELCLARLGALRELGVELAMDDFGTGYSSLTYLRQLPVQVVKIDQSFVRGLVGNSRDAAIVGSVIHLALACGLDVTAEGVESVEQLDRLVRLGCRRGQGWLFGRAAPAGVVEALFGVDLVAAVRALALEEPDRVSAAHLPSVAAVR